MQGEGPSLGAPCVFLRLGHCNLRCRWCDTPYTWDFRRYPYAQEVRERSVLELAAELEKSPRIVVTGGEPLLQEDAVTELVLSLPPEIPIEIETNGTLAPGSALARRVDQWNVSPKLRNSGEPTARTLNEKVLSAFKRTGRAWLKLVIETDADLDEAEALTQSLRWPRQRCFLMPQAATRAELRARGPSLAEACLRRGFRYSTRLHVALWDGERGR